MIPSLSVQPTTYVVDRKHVLKLSDNDIKIVKSIFDLTIIVKFWKDRPALDEIYDDMKRKRGIVGRFVLVLLIWFGLNSRVQC